MTRLLGILILVAGCVMVPAIILFNAIQEVSKVVA